MQEIKFKIEKIINFKKRPSSSFLPNLPPEAQQEHITL